MPPPSQICALAAILTSTRGTSRALERLNLHFIQWPSSSLSLLPSLFIDNFRLFLTSLHGIKIQYCELDNLHPHLRTSQLIFFFYRSMRIIPNIYTFLSSHSQHLHFPFIPSPTSTLSFHCWNYLEKIPCSLLFKWYVRNQRSAWWFSIHLESIWGRSTVITIIIGVA